MIKGFLLKKTSMTRRFNKKGLLVAGTICQAVPGFVTGVSSDKETGSGVVSLAFGSKKRVNRPLVGQLKKAGLKITPEIIREFKLEGKDVLPKLGEKILVNQILSIGDIVNVAGVTKGRGFAGVIKRWGFHSQPATHGQKDRERSPGSIGAQTPGKVVKGKKMPGHYGATQRTIRNLEVLDINKENSQVLIKGGLPGHRGSWLMVVLTGEVKRNRENKKD